MNTRAEAIDIILSNKIQAGLILPGEEGKIIKQLDDSDNIILGLMLVESRHLLDLSLELNAWSRRN